MVMVFYVLKAIICVRYVSYVCLLFVYKSCYIPCSPYLLGLVWLWIIALLDVQFH